MSVDSAYTNFYNWIKANNGQIHEHIKIDAKDERGLFTTDSIEPYTALAIIPWSLVINNQHPDLSTITTETERQSLIIFLLREYVKYDQSFWFPWLKLLNIEKEAENLLKTKMYLFNCVEHSTLGQAITDRYQKLQQEYEELNQSNLIETNLDLFCAIDHLIWSRILDLPENEPLSLVPFIDFANHSLNPNARWFIDDQTHNIILRSERNINSNEEITISYGSKSNEELLYLYGFSLAENLNDRVTLPVSLLSDDHLLEDKLCLIQQLKLPPRLTLDIDGYLTDQSNRLVKILTAQSETTIDKDHEDYKPYLQNLLNDYLSKLDMCSNEDKFIKYYLDSQKLIVQKALDNFK